MIRLETNRGKTTDEYAAAISSILRFHEIDPASFAGGIIASVVPELTDTLCGALRMITGCDPLLVGAGLRSGIRLNVDDPGTVAGDLGATAVAAKHDLPLPCVIIDMGTAITMTAVNEKGEFIGGAFLPGLELSIDAMSARTSLLPSVDVTAPKKVIATTTIDCMKSGVIYGLAGAVDGLLDRFQEELGPLGSIAVTGNRAELIAGICRHPLRVENGLMLRGLWYIWEANQASAKGGRRTKTK